MDRAVPVGEVGITGLRLADAALRPQNRLRLRGDSRPFPSSWRLVLRNVVLAVTLVVTGLIITASTRSFLDACLPALLAATAVVMAAAAGRMGATAFRHPSVSAKQAVAAS